MTQLIVSVRSSREVGPALQGGAGCQQCGCCQSVGCCNGGATPPSGDEPKHGQHVGILLVELGVGITVATVMISIFFSFAGRERAR